jgi:hypothetical protein
MRNLIRQILGVYPPFIGEARALTIAREELQRRRIEVSEEVAVREGLRSYRVQFGRLHIKPSGPSIDIDLMSGQVLSFVCYNK